MPDSDLTAHVLIDTDTTLHFRRMEDIDWRKLTGASEVVIVIAPVLLRELEKHKVTHNSRKIRDRAGKTVKWLGKFNFSGKNSIREGVFLRFIAHEPKIDFKSHSLSHDIADDHLIASALDYASQPDIKELVFIATDDIGLKVKVAAREGIEILELPKELRLKPEPDKTEAENAKLRQRVAALESRTPQLSVAFKGGESRQELFFSKSTMKKVLPPSQIREKHPLKAVNVPAEELQKQQASWGPRINIRKSNIRYNEILERYYERYDKYYADMVAYEEEMSLCFWLQLVISNDGTAPASGIDLHLYLPEGVKATDDLPDKPKRPSPPGERLHNLMGSGDLHNYAHLASAHLANSNNGNPRIEGNGSVVRISVDDLKHGFEAECDDIKLRFRDCQSIKSFNMKFSISANEMPVATEGTLHVIAKVRDT